MLHVKHVKKYIHRAWVQRVAFFAAFKKVKLLSTFIHMMLFCDLHVLIVQYVNSLNENNGLNTSDTWKAERFLQVSYFVIFGCMFYM